MHRPAMKSHRPGFTLPELLIAGAIGVVVIGLALRSFGEITKVMASSRSKVEAQRQAATGIDQVSGLFRKAHVFYYGARPLAAQPAEVTGRPGQHAPRLPVPNALLTLGSTGNTMRPPADRDRQTNEADWRAGSPASKRAFRFTDPLEGTPAFRLEVAPGRRGGDRYDDEFQGPLAYFAEAEFVRTGTGADSNPHALLPRTWTIRLLYLAPMALPPGDPNVAEPNNPRDQLPPPLPPSRPPGRTAVPYELRMLTIPGVYAGAPAPPATATVQPPGIPASHTARFDPTVGRILAPNLSAGETAFLEPPFDYDGSRANAQANYDPIPIPMTADPASFLDPAGGAPVYRFRGPAGEQLGRFPSGPRGAGGGIHANFNMLGNDPPTQDALQNRDPAAGQPTDKLLVSYVDPDASGGTAFRFVNNMREAPAGAAGADGTLPIPAPGRPYRRDVDMTGPGCDYFENRYHAAWNDTTSGTATGAYGALPERALVSVSIRYRARKDVPFQFATVQAEVPLDGLASFDKIRPRR